MADSLKVERTELTLSWALRIGVFLCGVILAVGLTARLLGIGHSSSSAQLIGELMSGKSVAEFHPVSSPGELFAGWDPDLVVTLGLMLLIALPIFRVAMTLVIFLHTRDWPFVVITFTVLSVLLSGIFLGRAL
jgi:uncharacterized membrane protein